MGIISIDKSNRLIWLGRYTERTFTICRTLNHVFDKMIDRDDEAYLEYLDALGIPHVYSGRDDFIKTYIFDESDPNSLASQLNRALDNGIEMREELTSDTLCYIQIAQNALRYSGNIAPILVLQRVIDDLFAFWGSADDNVASEESRTLLKCGKYVERLDLYVRLGYKFSDVEKETSKLLNRLEKAHFANVQENARKLREWTKDEETYNASKQSILNLLWQILV